MWVMFKTVSYELFWIIYNNGIFSETFFTKDTSLSISSSFFLLHCTAALNSMSIKKYAEVVRAQVQCFSLSLSLSLSLFLLGLRKTCATYRYLKRWLYQQKKPTWLNDIIDNFSQFWHSVSQGRLNIYTNIFNRKICSFAENNVLCQKLNYFYYKLYIEKI